MRNLNLPNVPIHDAQWIKARPIAHRGLHDATNGIYENTLSAVVAAIDNGYAIEVDLQPSADGVAMVFHDYELDRLTSMKGEVRKTSSAELVQYQIGGTDDRIPTLNDLLELVGGRAGLVLELKGRIDDDEGFVEAVASELSRYSGAVAVMSFYHHLIFSARNLMPDIPVGLTAEGDNDEWDQHVEAATTANVDFVSYELANLDKDFPQAFRAAGRPLISWTVRSPKDRAHSDKFADQPTFEGFLA